jgi:hypothetical protein
MAPSNRNRQRSAIPEQEGEAQPLKHSPRRKGGSEEETDDSSDAKTEEDAELVALLAQARRDERRAIQRIELARIHENIANLAATERALSERNTTVVNTPQESLSQTSETLLPVRPAKELQPEKLPLYYGKSVREHREWTRSAENAHRLAPNTFSQDVAKISHAFQFIRGTPYSAWIEKERSIAPNLITWEYFSEFLLNLIEDPENRQLDALQAYMDAAQRPSQSTQDFNSYLLGLESQIQDPYTASQLRGHLWCKLRPDMRAALSNYQEIPKTRDQLVTLATRLESNKRRATASRVYPDRDPKRNRPEITREPPRETRPHNSTGARLPQARSMGNPNQIPIKKSPDHVTCYNCHKVGHYKDKCPEPPQSQREIAYINTKESDDSEGNDSASR